MSVAALGRSWRERKADGGVVVDVETDARGLRMEETLRSVVAVRPEVVMLSSIPDRGTANLVAQLATAGGGRPQLAHTANQVFLDLVDSLKEQEARLQYEQWAENLQGVDEAALLPLHRAVFKGLVREIARRAGCELVEKPRPFTPDDRDLCSLPRR